MLLTPFPLRLKDFRATSKAMLKLSLLPWVSALLPSKGAIEHECAAGYAPDCGLWVITIRS